jgi:GNAT superfamily N-acetyltransferase
MSALRVEPLAPAHLAAWAALFAESDSPCHCRYWHFEGDKNAWLERCFGAPEQNRAEQEALVRAGAPAAFGLVALTEEGACVGWMKLAPRAVLPKLLRRGPYRALERTDAEGVWSVGCFLVHPAWRRKGVARALLAAAPEHARARGARVLEAYPRTSTEELRDDEAWTGPERLYQACGFSVAGGERPYPVLRRML